MNNHNFNSQSVELYAMLEIELSVFLPPSSSAAGIDVASSKQPVVDTNLPLLSSSGDPIVFDKLHVPVICCAEHSVLPLTVMSQLTSV